MTQNNEAVVYVMCVHDFFTNHNLTWKAAVLKLLSVSERNKTIAKYNVFIYLHFDLVTHLCRDSGNGKLFESAVHPFCKYYIISVIYI